MAPPGAKPGGTASQPQQALPQEGGADHEHRGERGLRGHERAPQPPARGRVRLAAIAQEARVPRAEGGPEAEQERGDDRERDREERDDRVRAQLRVAGEHVGGEPGEEGRGRGGEGEAESAPQCGKEEALREDLLHEAPSARAQGLADGELVRPRRGPPELEVGHVGADDEEEDAHRGEEQEDGGALRLREGGVVVLQPDAHLGVRVRVGLLQAARDRRHLLPRLLHRDPGPPPRDDAQVVGPPLLDEIGGLEPEGQPELDVAGGEEEGRRHDPDHREGLAVQSDRAADDPRVAPELRLPQAVAQDGDALLALVGLFLRERAAGVRGHAEHVEEIARRVERLQSLRLALAGQGDVVADVGRHAREGGVRLRQSAKFAGAAETPVQFFRGLVSVISTRRSGSA